MTIGYGFSKKFKLYAVRSSYGFTIVELLVSIGILLILYTLTSLSITRMPSTTSQSTDINTLLSDLRSQQTKAMSGKTSGGASGSPYGVYFGTNRYTLFKGATYNAVNPDNFTVELGSNLSFTNVTFPGSVIVFNQGNGDIVGYNESVPADSFSITNSLTNTVTTYKINKYGATY